jgi:acyl carrier protein
MADTKDTYQRVQEIICKQLNVEAEKVTPNTTFTEDLGADSLDVVELVMVFEEEFDIEIDDQAAGEMATVQDVVKYIEENF